MKIVVLDPGHGGDGRLTSYGGSGNGLVEKTLNLTLSKMIEERLLDYEVDVRLTRTGDHDVPWADRAAFGRGADLLVSVHFNAFRDPNANGFESFIWNGRVLPATAENQRIIHSHVYGYLKDAGVVDRGMKRANFAMLRNPPCSAVLLEYVFITNPREADLIKRPGVMDNLARTTARGIAEALNLPLKAEEPKTLREMLLNIRDQLDEAIALT